MNTYTVNVNLIFALSPIFIAILSYFVNNESFNFRLIFTTIVCFVGTHSLTHSFILLLIHFLTYLLAHVAVGCIFYVDSVQDYDKPSEKDDDDIGSQGTNWYIVYGNIMAIIGAFSFAVFMVVTTTNSLPYSITVYYFLAYSLTHSLTYLLPQLGIDK